MNRRFFRGIWYAITICLTGGALSVAAAGFQLARGNDIHYCAVIDSQSNTQYSDQFPDRNYARSAAASVNSGEPRTVRMIYSCPTTVRIALISFSR